MKQIVSNYSYSPATNVVTLTGVNIDADQLLLIVAPQVGRTLYNFASVTGTVSAGADTRVSLNASTAGLTTTSPLVIFYDDQASAQTVTGTVALDPASLIALENITVTVGSSVALAAGSAQIGSVTVANFPSTQTIAGTVTANIVGRAVNNSSEPQFPPIPLIGFDEAIQDADRGFVVPVQLTNNSGTILNEVPISGTVTANGRSDIYDSVNDVYWNKSVIAFGNPFLEEPTLIGPTNPLPISGTVTANNPSGALTTRFGSVTTANTAQITSAVTNANRKYLLAQNISAGTVTIGIGFSPTTTQGIQLTAGGGLTFDAFCPTGAVYWLGAVTGAAFTILEG